MLIHTVSPCRWWCVYRGEVPTRVGHFIFVSPETRIWTMAPQVPQWPNPAPQTGRLTHCVLCGVKLHDRHCCTNLGRSPSASLLKSSTAWVNGKGLAGLFTRLMRQQQWWRSLVSGQRYKCKALSSSPYSCVDITTQISKVCTESL